MNCQFIRAFEQNVLAFEVIKLFSCSFQLSIKFILLINVKMSTIVGILTFISRIKTSESFRQRNIIIFQHFNFCEQWKLHSQLSMKKFYSLEPVHNHVASLFC